jgi:hypothetical protein
MKRFLAALLFCLSFTSAALANQTNLGSSYNLASTVTTQLALDTADTYTGIAPDNNAIRYTLFNAYVNNTSSSTALLTLIIKRDGAQIANSGALTLQPGNNQVQLPFYDSGMSTGSHTYTAWATGSGSSIFTFTTSTFLLIAAPSQYAVASLSSGVSVGSGLTGGTDKRCLFDDVNKFGEDAGCTYNKGTGVLTSIFSGNLTGNVTGNVTGNASTATALAAVPTGCTLPNFAYAISASGNLTCSAIPETYVTNLASDLANLQAQITTGQPGAQGNVITTPGGCGVAWTGNYTYAVSACTYYIQGVQYTSPATNVTLTTADPTNDRFDAIVVTSSGTATFVTGAAQVNPTVPTIDSTTQIALTYVFVTHNTTAAVGASNENIYLENTEWPVTNGTGWNSADTSSPRTGTKDVKATAVATGALERFIRASTLTLNGFQQLNIWTKPITWVSTRTLLINFRDANGVLVGNTVTLQNGSFGFVAATTTAYQLVAIPLSLFAVPAGASVQELRFNPQGSGTALSALFDDITLQATTNQILPGGATYATQYKDPNGLSAGTGPGTSGQLLTSQGSTSPPLYQTLVTPSASIVIPGAACQNATATLNWDTPTTSPAVANCVTGTNTQKGVADFAAASNLSMQVTLKLPVNDPDTSKGGYRSAGTTQANIKWLSATTSGAVVWQLATACVAAGATDDPAFNTASTVTTTTQGTANQTSDSQITPLTMTGCAAGNILHLKLSRNAGVGADTMAGTARLISVELVVPRN